MGDKRSDLIKKALVSLAIERALLRVGRPTYEKAVEVLYKKYRCYLPDCYEHPEYLANILKEFFGDAGKVIVESIKKDLSEFSDLEPVTKFLRIISQ